MKTNRRAFIKRMNWGLAGVIGLLGFGGCVKFGEEEHVILEYGLQPANYTIKGAVVNKANKKPIEGIRVGYSCESCPVSEYGVIPTPYTPKAHVLTNSKGEFKLTDSFSHEKNKILPFYVEDVDGEKNGSFQPQYLQVDFSKADRIKNPNGWFDGEYTVTVNVELTEIKNG